MMNAQFQTLERTNLTAPFGVRFRDTASGAFISAGLTVTVIQANERAARTTAEANRSGVFVVHHLPGFRAFELQSEAASIWNPAPATQSFDVEVTDEARRFQPFRLRVDLPLQGMYRWESPVGPTSPLSPPANDAALVRPVPLYSSAARVAPTGMAALRADLWDAHNNIPAAWAVVEAFFDGALLARGLADAAGRLAIIFPYPAPQRFSVQSPVTSPVDNRVLTTGPALNDQVWNIELRFRYAATRALASPLSPLDQRAGASELPNLHDTLNQPAARAFQNFANRLALARVPVRFGSDNSLASDDSKSQPEQSRTLHQNSVLFISPAV